MSEDNKSSQTLSFERPQKGGFSTELRLRVNNYFKENKIEKHGNWRVYLKAMVWMTTYLVPFILIITLDLNLWICFGLALIMGISKAGIGLNIMHDANHGSYTSNKWVNLLAQKSLVLMGGSPLSWRLQHNVQHHTFTNVLHHDGDVSPGPVMRFSPNADRKWFHRFQHFYSPLFYGVMTLVWALHKDFEQLNLFSKMGLIEKHGSTFWKQFWSIVAIKIFYFGYILVLPLMVMDISFGQWLVGFLSMHFVAGLLLALVFQSAHVITETEHPQPSEAGHIEDEWFAHQLRTTANFATRSRWFSWFAGGLNYQVEHHLFPNVSHVHYRALSKIVKECTEEYELPYHEAPTFFNAIGSHFRMLKQLGRA